MKLLRKLRNWYKWKKYGICPIHLILARAGGGYEPKWICDMCDEENRIKNEDRIRKYEHKRLQVLRGMK
jgi:hypothetical protein